ncbi:MAG: FHA domain-containing protein [Alphaproteobacteria bacterium]
MAIRGPDGKEIRPPDPASEETTRKIQRRSIKDRIAAGDEHDPEAPTHMISGNQDFAQDTAKRDAGGNPRGGYIDEESDTSPRNRPSAAQPAAPAAPAPRAEDVVHTQIYRPKRAADPAAPADAKPAPEVSEKGDPVVGWLVVVDGPGRGSSFNLGYGNNRMGRAPTEAIAINFGDNQISRENHATITYDGRTRRYFVKEGDGRNLIYVGDDPVLAPVELKGGEVLTLGETKLKFVPFCGKDFDWQSK